MTATATTAKSARAAPANGAPDRNPPAGRIIGQSSVRLWGLTSSERLQRSFVRAGVACPPSAVAAVDGTQLLVRADYVFDEALIRDLAAAPGTVLATPDGLTPVAAHVEAAEAPPLAAALTDGAALPAPLRARLRVVRPSELSPAFRNPLRKREPPYVLKLAEADRPAIERRMFDASYKGVTDFVTKYVWPAPAFRVTRWAAAAGVTPNAVTWASLALVVAAFWLFAEGWFLAGLAAAWAMTFLDTVDGKLARVTLSSTKLGNVFDHGIDLIHPPFWYFAWIAGLDAAGLGLPWAAPVLAIVIGGYVLGRLQEGLFLWLFGIEIHVWRPIDSRFRLVTARRNPNLFLLTLGAIAGRPDLGMLAVAVWTVASFAFHTVRILQALRARRHGSVVSWLAAP